MMQEDDLVRNLVNRLGDKSWVALAPHIATRTAKQIRERWHNHIDPNIVKVSKHIGIHNGTCSTHLHCLWTHSAARKRVRTQESQYTHKSHKHKKSANANHSIHTWRQLPHIHSHMEATPTYTLMHTKQVRTYATLCKLFRAQVQSQI